MWLVNRKCNNQLETQITTRQIQQTYKTNWTKWQTIQKRITFHRSRFFEDLGIDFWWCLASLEQFQNEVIFDGWPGGEGRGRLKFEDEDLWMLIHVWPSLIGQTASQQTACRHSFAAGSTQNTRMQACSILFAAWCPPKKGPADLWVGIIANASTWIEVNEIA